MSQYKKKYESGEFVILNTHNVPLDYLKAYYRTGLVVILKEYSEKWQIVSWSEVAFNAILKEQSSWSEGDLRRRFWERFFKASKFNMEIDSEFINHAKLLLQKVYDHVWGMPRTYKRAFALEPDATEYNGLIARLTEFGRRQQESGESDLAYLIKQIAVSIEAFYS